MSLTFQRIDAYHATAGDYTIARCHRGIGGAYVASVKGERLAVEHYTNADEDKAAYGRAKRACELHAEGE